MQLKSVVRLLNDHSTLKLHISHVIGLCGDPTHRRDKESESSFHILYECDNFATLRYFFLGLELDREDIRRNLTKINPGL